MAITAKLEPRRCHRCGAPLAGAELSGNCPRCLATLLLSPEPANTVEPLPVPVLRRLGDYELLAEVARGGMGVVFRARQVSLGRIVAIKVLRDAWLATPVQVKRFRAEAANAAKLKHPHIVAVHEVGEQGGQHYFAMDLVEGTNLAELTSNGPLPQRRAAELVRKVAEAVQHAHQEGVLHRDIKPSNVLVDDQGEPHVTDFGLGRLLEEESSLTLTGQVLGTPGYIAPEQAQGGATVGPAADVYGVGAVLFHLLTGRAPFVGASTAETLTHVLQQEPLSPRLLNPTVPVDLAAVCLKCLRKMPRERYGSAGELAADLGRFLGKETTHARPAGPMLQGVRWCRRKPVLAAFLITVPLTLISGLITTLWQWQRAEAESLKFQFSNYAADMNLAARALEDSDFGRTMELLNKHRPQNGRSDFRGWEWRYLSECSRSDELRFLGRHSKRVSVVAFSSDGRLLASGGADGVIRFWKTGSWESAGEWRVPGGVGTMAFSPDGKTLATGLLNNQIIAWDLTNKQALFTNQWNGGTIKFGRNAGELLAGSSDGRVAILDARTGETRAEIRAAGEWIRALALSPDGQRLWVGTEDYSMSQGDAMTAWDTTTRKKLWSKTPHPYYVRDLQCSPDGRIVASCGGESVVRLWDAQDGSPVGELKGHLWYIYSLSFSPDGRWLASGSADQTIILWDVAKRTLAARFHGNDEEVSSVAFSPDGTSLVSGSTDGAMRLWPAAPPPTNANHVALPPGMFEGKISRSGKLLLLMYADGLQLRETASGKLLGRRRDSLGAGISPDESLVISVGRDLQQAVCSVPELSVLKLLSRIPEGDLVKAAFSFDGRIFAEGGKSGKVTLLDWKAGKLLAACQLPDEVRSITFGPHDDTFATGGEQGSLRLWRTADAFLLGSFAGHRTSVEALSFSPGGTRLVSASSDATARLWDVKTGRELQVFKGHRMGVHNVVFSSDGRRLFTGGADGEIRVWDVASGQLLLALRAHPLEMRLALQSDDTLISASIDGVRFWRAPALPVIESLAEH